MNTLPKDPVMLLSMINMKLRDFYPSIQDLCEDLQIDRKDLEERLAAIDYAYDPDSNQFV